MHRKLILVTILVFVSAMLLGTVQAQVITNSLTQANGDTDWVVVQGDTYGVEIAGDDNYIYQVYFQIKKYSGTTTGTVFAALYNSTGYLLEQSDNVALGNSGSYANITFAFDGDTQMVTGTDYAVVVHFESIVGGQYSMLADGTSPGQDMIISVHADHYHTSGVQCPVYYLYTVNVELEEETTDWDVETSELIDNAVNFLVPLVVMLLPAVLFIIFFKKTDKWLILIGLAIGVGLGYYFFNIPVWLVFLVAIGLIGLAYSEVRRNG